MDRDLVSIEWETGWATVGVGLLEKRMGKVGVNSVTSE
jgi:hypothetical protein